MAGQEPLAPLGPITEPAAAPVSATPSSAEIAQGQQRASAYSLDPNYRPSRGQSQRDPVQLKQSGWLGNGQMARGQASGGDPLFAATMAVPTFEVDQQISNVRQQKQELADWISKQGEQFKGKAADPYQPAYEQYVGSEQGKFIKDVADTYFEGDVNKAWLGVKNDPELRAQWDRNIRYLAAIGQANKGGYDTYAKIDQAINDGEMEVSPDTRSLLEDALNAKWSFDGSSPAHSASKFDQLNEKLSVEKMFNEYYKPLVKDAGDQTTGNNRIITEKGRKFLVTDSKEEYDQFIDQFVKKAKKEGQWRNEDELRQYAEGMVGTMNKETWKELRAPKSSSGGSGAADKVWSSPVTQAKTNIGAPLTTTEKGDGYQRRTPVNDTMAVGKIVGDRQEPFGVLSFKKGADIVRMSWASIDRGPDGEFVLVGTGPADTETATNIDNLNAQIGDLNAIIRSPYAGEEEKKAKATAERDKLLNELRTTQKRSKMVVVPLKGNESAADGYLGGTLQQKLAQFGGTQQAKPAGGKTIAGF